MSALDYKSPLKEAMEESVRVLKPLIDWADNQPQSTLSTYFWHGEAANNKGGMLEQIEKEGVALEFFDALEDVIKADVIMACSGATVIWRMITATPNQMCRALEVANLRLGYKKKE